MTPIAEIRGFRNHNPGNIRHGEKWLGLAPEQPDSAFCTFVSPEYGIRAMGRILANYKRRYGISTVRGVIARWAPPTENDTEAYIRHVCAGVVAGPDEAIDVEDPHTLTALTAAIIKHECCINPYSFALIKRGVDMALEASA